MRGRLRKDSTFCFDRKAAINQVLSRRGETQHTPRLDKTRFAVRQKDAGQAIRTPSMKERTKQLMEVAGASLLCPHCWRHVASGPHEDSFLCVHCDLLIPLRQVVNSIMTDVRN